MASQQGRKGQKKWWPLCGYRLIRTFDVLETPDDDEDAPDPVVRLAAQAAPARSRVARGDGCWCLSPSSRSASAPRQWYEFSVSAADEASGGSSLTFSISAARAGDAGAGGEVLVSDPSYTDAWRAFAAEFLPDPAGDGELDGAEGDDAPPAPTENEAKAAAKALEKVAAKQFGFLEGDVKKRLQEIAMAEGLSAAATARAAGAAPSGTRKTGMAGGPAAGRLAEEDAGLQEVRAHCVGTKPSGGRLAKKCVLPLTISGRCMSCAVLSGLGQQGQAGKRET